MASCMIFCVKITDVEKHGCEVPVGPENPVGANVLDPKCLGSAAALPVSTHQLGPHRPWFGTLQLIGAPVISSPPASE